MSKRRFLFVGFSDRGHLNPVISVAQQLTRGGDEVAIFSVQDDVTAAFQAAGLEVRCWHAPTPSVVGERAESQRSVRLARRLSNAAWLKRWTMATIVAPIKAQTAALDALVREVRPDVVVTDAMAYAGAIVAERYDIPWATFAVGLHSFRASDGSNLYVDVIRQLAPKRDEAIAAEAAALAFRETDVVSPRVNIVFAFPGLVEADATVAFVGPALPSGKRGDEPAFPFERIPADRPLVYVSFGSHLSHSPEVYEALVGSLSSDEAFFVLTLKDLLDEPFARALPKHALAVEYAPQLALLERADVMVNHGGVNSVMECLSRGKPMLVMPLAYDQHVVAEVVVRNRLGLALDAAEATASCCREALQRLVRADAPERANAAAFARESDGAADAATLLRAL